MRVGSTWFQRSGLALALAGLLTLCLLPAEAEAQVRLLPSVGVYAPISDLGSIRESDGQVLVDAGRRDATLAFGLGLELGNSQGFASIRGQLGYATAANVPIDAVGCAHCELRSTLLTATAAVVLRPLPQLAVAQPFVVAGGGLKRYGFDREDLGTSGFIDGFRDQGQRTVQLGVGMQFALGPIRPVVELSGYVSRYEVEPANGGREGSDDRQTDLMLTIAFPLGGGE
jgi:hypothetical protein